MKQIGVLVLLGFLPLAACATLKPMIQGDVRQKPASEVPVVATRELRPGMSPEEVKAVLGEPDDLIIYSGAGPCERWQYYHYPDCAAPATNRGPITELMFMDGRLKEWLSYKKPQREGTESK